MRKYLFISALLILNIFSATAQTDVINKDELFKTDTMTAIFKKLGKKQLIDLYAFDKNSERLIRAHFYHNRLRFQVIPAAFVLLLSIYGESILIPVAINGKQDAQFIALLFSAGFVAITAYEGYLIYEGIEAHQLAGKKSNLYNRLRNYYITKKLTDQDQKIIDKHKNRRIPFVFEATGLIKR